MVIKIIYLIMISPVPSKARHIANYHHKGTKRNPEFLRGQTNDTIASAVKHVVKILIF
ncbi:MAG: hypothetical protein ACYDA4_09090 [Ignavibacteriaceae bacterium]